MPIPGIEDASEKGILYELEGSTITTLFFIRRNTEAATLEYILGKIGRDPKMFFAQHIQQLPIVHFYEIYEGTTLGDFGWCGVFIPEKGAPLSKVIDKLIETKNSRGIVFSDIPTL